MNLFSSIETTRLMLLPGENTRDNASFLQMLKDDGDFRQFCGIDYSELNLLKFDGYLQWDFLYAIYLKDSLTELLGHIGLGQRNGEHYEIEFYIKRPERRKGYCTEALHTLCKTAFAGRFAAMNERNEREPLLLDKIYAVTTVENLAAKRPLEKNGFLRPNTGAVPVLMGYIDPETETMCANRIVEYVLEKPQIGGREKDGQKIQLAEVFRDTQNFYQENSVLARGVRDSMKETRLYAADDYPALLPQTERAGLVRVSKHKTFQAAMELCRTAYPEKKIAVLNFASATKPGGGVKNGSSAQEESLCRCSTLYPTLDQQWLWDSFYHANRAVHDPLHSDACIYSPGVVICKTDDDVPARLQSEEFVTVDVISCAAPNLRPSRDGKTAKIPHDELYRLLRCRTMHILHVAAANRVDVLVLGAFGCGVFANDPQLVQRAFSAALDEYRKRFD